MAPARPLRRVYDGYGAVWGSKTTQRRSRSSDVLWTGKITNGGIGMSKRPMLGKIVPAHARWWGVAAGPAAAAVASLLMVSAAFADQQLEEIVVTAEKRSENVQNVP